MIGEPGIADPPVGKRLVQKIDRAQTHETEYSVKQEKAYSETIRAMLRVIAQNPEIGLKGEELTEGLRSFLW